jgi:hypothetical protein
MLKSTGEYSCLVEKAEEKGPFRRTNCRWKDNIEKDIKEIGWEALEGIDVFQDADIWGLF